MMPTRTLAAASVALLLPVLAFAQTTTPAESADEASLDQIQQDVAAPQGTVNCFDFYRFGSVQAHLTAPVVSTVSGSSITFSGTLENQNPYPIVDGALYVKVMRTRGSTKDANGPDVVDQFLVKGDLVIPAKSSIPVSFAWKVPAYAKSGDYTLATFFTTSRKFNLLGLSFTDDVVGNTVPFSVKGELKTGVGFDKAGVTVGGEKYYFAAFPPRVSATSSVDVVAQVMNSGTTDERASVMWTVYQWDAQLRENVVQEMSATSVTIPAGKSVPIKATVSDTKYPVYLAVATLSWKDTKSIINVRFVRDGVDRTRINFPGVLSYPLKAGQQATVFSCLHNAGSSDIVEGGKLELTLSDMRGNPIHTYTYTGAVTGAMMGVADSFTPTRDYDRFMLDARLYQGDTYVDEAHLVYDCDTIAPGTCSPQDASTMGSMDFSAVFMNSNLLLGVGTLIVLFIILIAALIARRLFFRGVSSLPTPDSGNQMPKI